MARVLSLGLIRAVTVGRELPQLGLHFGNDTTRRGQWVNRDQRGPSRPCGARFLRTEHRLTTAVMPCPPVLVKPLDLFSLLAAACSIAPGSILHAFSGLRFPTPKGVV